MILIISQHNGEHTTDIVCDWLSYNNANFKRLNGKKAFMSTTVIENNASVNQHKTISPDNDISYDVIWNRRWLSREFFYENGEITENPLLNRSIIEYLQTEHQSYKGYLLSQFKYKHILGDFSAININKLKVLSLAQELGIRIPATLVTSQKIDLEDFSKRLQNIICKNLFDPYFFSIGNRSFATYTALLEEKSIEGLPEQFYPTLFQEYVEKEFEIRSFFLDGEFYSMAIFSQTNEKTQVDFRRYDFKKPNRCVPYRLPDTLASKLKQLLNQLNLNTASVDLIKTPKGEFVFLEINATGQFGMTSEPCNYYLERKVAEWLIKKNECND